MHSSMTNNAFINDQCETYKNKTSENLKDLVGQSIYCLPTLLVTKSPASSTIRTIML